MDPKVKELMYMSGADEKLSSLLIEFTGGDIEGASKIIEAMPKNYIAIKVRYMAHKAHYYGVILIVIDLKQKSFENIFLVADKNKDASQIDTTLKYDEFKEKIISYVKKQDHDIEMMGRLKEAINTENFKEKVFAKSDGDNRLDTEQLKVVFSELFSRVLTEQNCAIKIETEEVDLFSVHESAYQYQVKKNKESDNDEKDSGTDGEKKKKEEVHIRNISLVLLKVEPVVAPVMGVPALELQVNDKIMVKIIDQREIGYYLSGLLDARENQESVPVPATIKEISKQEDTDNLMIIVEFGPGIAGKMHISPEIKIEIPGLEEEEVEESPGFPKINFLWIIFFLIIVFFIILLFTIFVNR